MRAQRRRERSVSGGVRMSSRDSGLSDEQIMLRFLRYVVFWNIEFSCSLIWLCAFCRDAVYYFLMERDSRDHLSAIMNILKFNEKQRSDVLKHKHIRFW